MLELVYLADQSAVLIRRRTAAFVLRERIERIDARLVEVEFTLRVLNFRRERSRAWPPALWRAAPAKR